MTLELTIACGDRDVNRALLEGEVSPDGIDPTVLAEYPPTRHRNFFAHGAYDVSEVSLASYLSSRSDPEATDCTAIPVFTNKRFRHAFFYVNAEAGVEEPADLAGRSVGVQSWQTTANVWMRGIAQEHYGLDLEDVTWYCRRRDDVPITVPDRFDIRAVPGAQAGDAVEEPRDLKDMLFSGELDAVMDPASSLFHAVVESDAAEFMFDDPLAEERAYFEATGIHPPMHVVAIRDAVLEADPWVATAVFDAFCDSRDRCIERSKHTGTHTLLTWAHLHYLEQEALLGPDVWVHGLTDRTRAEVAKFVEYALDQGLITRSFEPEALFDERTHDPR